MVSETGAPEHYLCHGELNQHHILMGPGYTAVIEFNKMHLGVQVADLYHFIRKAMEKHGWNMKLGMRLLNSYDRVLTMGEKEREYLYYSFLYPEKILETAQLLLQCEQGMDPVQKRREAAESGNPAEGQK